MSTEADRYRALLEFGNPSPRQRETLEALIACDGDRHAAAKAVGVGKKTLDKYVSIVSQRAAARGYSPEHNMVHTTPANYHVQGTTTLYGEDGNPRMQWVKTRKNQEDRLQALEEAVQVLAEPFVATSYLPPEPVHADDDLLAVYPMGDPHLGMYAWHAETGESFDLHIAERNLLTAADTLVTIAPPASEALVVNLGDFFHADNMQNRTSRSGAALDVDTRWGKVLQTGVRVMRRIIDRALEKHRKVTVISAIGNHDDHSALMLSLCLAEHYENNHRVFIDISPSKFHWYRFGKCLFGITHGDTVSKGQTLQGIMAQDKAEDWGETLYRYWLCGHVHHDSVKEVNGVLIETFRTLAARDAWHHGQGYRSGRDMKVDVYHRLYGRVNRYIVGIQQIYDAIATGGVRP